MLDCCESPIWFLTGIRQMHKDRKLCVSFIFKNKHIDSWRKLKQWWRGQYVLLWCQNMGDLKILKCNTLTWLLGMLTNYSISLINIIIPYYLLEMRLGSACQSLWVRCKWILSTSVAHLFETAVAFHFPWCSWMQKWESLKRDYAHHT